MIRLLLSGCLVWIASQAQPTAAATPPWLERFCRAMDDVSPCRLVVRSHLIVDGEERLNSIREMRSGGGVIWTSQASFDSETGERSGNALVASSDGVEVRSVRGWQPGDDVAVPVRPMSRFFRSVRGRIEPADPATPFVPTAVWTIGVRPTQALTYSELFLGRAPDALKFEEVGGGQVLITVQQPSGRRRQLKDSAFLFDPTADWPLLEFRPPNPDDGVTTYSDVREVAGRWLPFRRDVTSPVYPDVVMRVEVLELSDACPAVEPLAFPEGMAVFDRREEDAVHIWGPGGPTQTITRAALQTYGRVPATPPADNAPGQFAGRNPGRDWTFWAVNGLLVATVVALFWLRRRMA